jgi:hypothetical protein
MDRRHGAVETQATVEVDDTCISALRARTETGPRARRRAANFVSENSQTGLARCV